MASNKAGTARYPFSEADHPDNGFPFQGESLQSVSGLNFMVRKTVAAIIYFDRAIWYFSNFAGLCTGE
jgi:hypothetical protein